jgi:hypothetical protein
MNKKDKPKRNRSAFIIFSSEMRSCMKADDKKKTNSNEMMVKLADLWKNLKEDEKKRYHDMANKEKVKYLLELNEFYQTHPYDVIQNKTKRNHVKKPCSAYGLFLKEVKKAVKIEQPELKMADVLKIVADRWKKLDQKQKSIYQDQAKVEKEAVKTKINEQAKDMSDDQNELMILPQKRLQSQKRVKKALLRENLKINDTYTESLKTEDTSVSSPFEEAVFAPTNNTFDTDFFNNFQGFIDDNMLFSSLPTYNLNRMPSVEPIFKQNSIEAKEEATSQTNNCYAPEFADIKNKKSNDFLMDLLSFHSQTDKCQNMNSLFNKTSSTFAPFSTQSTNARSAYNDALLSALAFEPSNEFDFDFLHFDTNCEMKL